MAITIPSYETLDRNLWESVKLATGVTEDSESGIMRNIVKLFSKNLYDLYSSLQDLDDAGNLSTAAGRDLDNLGELFGLTRLSAKTASTAGTGAAVKLTNTSSVSINVRSGSRVWVSSDSTIVFYTITDSGTIAPGAQAYVDISAGSAGSRYNVAAGKIDSCNIAGISVINELPITGGSSEESDTDFRVRISQALTTFQGANSISIKNSLIQIPQVIDVIIQNLARGTGTIDVVLYTTDISPDSQAQVLSEAQRVLDNTVALGISAKAKFPDVQWVDLTILLTTMPGADVTSIRTNATIAARTYINNLSIGDGNGSGNLIYSELAARIQESDINIIDSSFTMKINNSRVLSMNQIAGSGERFYVRTVNFQ